MLQLFFFNAGNAYDEILYLSSSNVGVFKVSPQYELDVLGSVNCSGSILQNGVVYESPWNSNTAVFGSNTSVWLSNVAFVSFNAANWASNTSLWASNVTSWASNVAFVSSNAANWASNTSLWASNNTSWTSNLVSQYNVTFVTSNLVASNLNVNALSTPNSLVNIASFNLDSVARNYPPSNLTSSPQPFRNFSYGNGTYTASASVNSALPLFDNAIFSLWSSSNYFNSGNYSLTTTSTVVSGTTYLGDYVQVQTPSNVRVMNYTITSSDTLGNYPKSWIVAGSTDGTTWSTVDSITNNTSMTTNNTPYTFNVNSQVICNYLRFIFLATRSGNTVSLAELRFNGFMQTNSQKPYC